MSFFFLFFLLVEQDIATPSRVQLLIACPSFPSLSSLFAFFFLSFCVCVISTLHLFVLQYIPSISTGSSTCTFVLFLLVFSFALSFSFLGPLLSFFLSLSLSLSLSLRLPSSVLALIGLSYLHYIHIEGCSL